MSDNFTETELRHLRIELSNMKATIINLKCKVDMMEYEMQKKEREELLPVKGIKFHPLMKKTR